MADSLARPAQKEWFGDPDETPGTWDAWMIWDSDYGWRVGRMVEYITNVDGWCLHWRAGGDKQYAHDVCGLRVFPIARDGDPVPAKWGVVGGKP